MYIWEREKRLRNKKKIKRDEYPYECNDESWEIYKITSFKIPKNTKIIQNS